MDDLERLVDKIQTPCYVFFEQKIRERFLSLKVGLPENVEVLFSVKANPNRDILCFLRSLGSWFDVSSKKEIEEVLAIGADPEKLSFVGPGKTRLDLDFAIEKKIGTVVVESVEEIFAVDALATGRKKLQKIALRVSPVSYFNSQGKLVSNHPTQFGVDQEDLPALLAALKHLNGVELIGTHTHVQSQILDADKILANFKITLENHVAIQKQWRRKISCVNFGGGLGIPYFEEQGPLDLKKFQAGVRDLIDDHLKMGTNAGSKFFIESGRYLTGESGYYLTKILRTKESRGEKFLIVDGGMSNHLGAAGFGQVLRKNWKISVIRRGQGQVEEKETYTVVGPSCYSQDVLAQKIELPRVGAGDWLVIHNSGAYGLTFSPHQFLGLAIAKEYFIAE